MPEEIQLLEVNKRYQMVHDAKGTLTVKILEDEGEAWAKVKVLEVPKDNTSFVGEVGDVLLIQKSLVIAWNEV